MRKKPQNKSQRDTVENPKNLHFLSRNENKSSALLQYQVSEQVSRKKLKEVSSETETSKRRSQMLQSPLAD